MDSSKCRTKLEAIRFREGIKQKDIAKSFDMSKQGFNNKLGRALTSFDLCDLIKFADIFNMKLAFIDKNDKIVESFDMSDIEEENI